MDKRLFALDAFIKNSGKLSFNTKQTYYIAIRQFLDACPKPLQDIEFEDIDLWLRHLRSDKLETTTIQTKASALREFFLFLIEKSLILRNPAESVKTPSGYRKVRTPLTIEELFYLREIVQNNLRDRAILELLICSGIRVSELISIKIEDIRWDEETIWIRLGKGEKERYVLFSFDCKQMLQDYLSSRNDKSSYLFITYRKAPFTRQGLHKLFKGWVKESDLPDSITLHSIRHTFATMAVEKNFELVQLSLLMGHGSLNSTNRYITTSNASRKMQYDTFYCD